MITLTREEAQQVLDALEAAWYHVGTLVPTEEAIDLYDAANKSLRAKLSEPEPEPVAIVQQEAIGRGQVLWVTPAPQVQDGIPLYTAPPQREWVGLTEEDIKDIEGWVEFKEAGSNERVPLGKLALYISHKIREKNA
jgi:hypothetical protein